MIITGAMPAWHFSGVSHHRRRSRQIDHDFAGAVAAPDASAYVCCPERSFMI